ncbi:hypothetical protein [Endozoicomonas arenosclerae]|uniref:hypothetical protein n=1 Tax=Endozoicomonas arenosclerae TaxID=1633495 RepID=UPI0007827EEE|nr:hypothetical protein [Endozoicomonas arenosclerae]
MLATHMDAKSRYEVFRQQARTLAHEELPRRLKKELHLSSVDSRALNAFKIWRDMPERRVDWDWTFASKYCFRYPKAFDLSVWHGSRLCSLSLGRPTYHGTSMRLDFIERTPKNSLFASDMFRISLLAYETYASLIGADYLRVVEPMNQKLIDYYTSHDTGFTFVPATKGNPCYLVKKL